MKYCLFPFTAKGVNNVLSIEVLPNFLLLKASGMCETPNFTGMQYCTAKI